MAIGRGPTHEDVTAAEEAICRVGMERLKNRPLDELSGGERQLVLIARALGQETPIICLDEPTDGLDLGNQAKVLTTVRDLAGLGRTILMTTHMPEHAFLLGARVMAIKRGAVLASGLAEQVCTELLLEELYDAPMQLLRSDGPEPVVACVPRLRAAASNGALWMKENEMKFTSPKYDKEQRDVRSFAGRGPDGNSD